MRTAATPTWPFAASSALSTRLAHTWLSSPPNPWMRGRSASTSRLTLHLFPAGFRVEHGERIGQPLADIHGFGHGRLVHVGEALHRRDEVVDPGGGRLDLRCQLVRRAAGDEPRKDRGERLAVERFREPVERVERDRGLRQRFRGGDIGAVTRQPVGDRVFTVRLLDGRAPEGRACRGQAGLARLVDGSLLIRRQSRGSERAGRRFDLRQPKLESLGAARDRRSGVVQLVREPCRQLAQGGHLFFLEVARREMAGAIDHDVHENRGEFVAVANQRRHLLAGDQQDLARHLGLHVARRRHETRVRQEPRHIAPMPLHDLVWSGAPVDVDREVAGKDDVQTEHRPGLRREHDSRLQPDQAAVLGKPRQLVGRRAGEQPVSGQTILDRGFQLAAGYISAGSSSAAGRSLFLSSSSSSVLASRPSEAATGRDPQGASRRSGRSRSSWTRSRRRRSAGPASRSPGRASRSGHARPSLPGRR